MPTVFDDPVVVQQINTCTLDSWRIDFVRVNGSTIDQAKSILHVMLVNRGTAGTEVNREALTYPIADMPAPLKTAAQTFHQALITALRNAGKIPPGTDIADIS